VLTKNGNGSLKKLAPFLATGREGNGALRGADPQALIPKAEEAEQFLKAIANAHRLMVLCELHQGEACVTKLQKTVGLSQSSLSQHLARLRQDALVKTRRESREIYYSLADERVRRMIALLYDMFCAKGCD